MDLSLTKREREEDIKETVENPSTIGDGAQRGINLSDSDGSVGSKEEEIAPSTPIFYPEIPNYAGSPSVAVNNRNRDFLQTMDDNAEHNSMYNQNLHYIAQARVQQQLGQRGIPLLQNQDVRHFYEGSRNFYMGHWSERYNRKMAGFEGTYQSSSPDEVFLRDKNISGGVKKASSDESVIGRFERDGVTNTIANQERGYDADTSRDSVEQKRKNGNKNMAKGNDKDSPTKRSKTLD